VSSVAVPLASRSGRADGHMEDCNRRSHEGVITPSELLLASEYILAFNFFIY